MTENQLKFYVAFKKIKNIACVEIYQSKILMHLQTDPKNVETKEGFTRDVSTIGSYGTGNLEVTVKNMEDFEKAKHLIDKAYNEG